MQILDGTNDEQLKKLSRIKIKTILISKRTFDDNKDKETYYNLIDLPYIKNISLNDMFCKITIEDIKPANSSNNQQRLFMILEINKGLTVKECFSLLETIVDNINFDIGIYMIEFIDAGLANFDFILQETSIFGSNLPSGEYQFSIQKNGQYKRSITNFGSKITFSINNLKFKNLENTNIKVLNESLRFYNPITKYTMLYNYIEQIQKTSIYEKHKKINKSEKDFNTLKTLNELDIENLIINGKKEKLTKEILFAIRETRNELYHETTLTNLEKVLYHYLLPLVLQIILNPNTKNLFNENRNIISEEKKKKLEKMNKSLNKLPQISLDIYGE